MPWIKRMRNPHAALAAALLMLVALPLAGQLPAGYAGSDACQACHEECQACHEEIYNAFAKSPHDGLETEKHRGYGGGFRFAARDS